MKVFLVGGAIRDSLLGIPHNENDWVVINSSHEEMIDKGFKQVGKNFPVYLHPQTKEEYALARKEKKIGKGHGDFTFDVNFKISLDEDLQRRDITINAIAKDENGNLYDPFHGVKDLKDRKIRVVSEAFAEDPLRLFRVARFKTKLAEFKFSITKDTLEMLTKMSLNNEVNFLSGERIWEETQKALRYRNSSIYFSTLKKIKAIKYFEGLDECYSKNLKLLKCLDSQKDMVSEKWALINLFSKKIEILEKKIRVPKKISNFRFTFEETYKMVNQKKINEKKFLSKLVSIKFFRNDLGVINALKLLKKINVISRKDFKRWRSLFVKLKSAKVNLKNMKPKEIKEKLFTKRLKIIMDFKDDT